MCVWLGLLWAGTLFGVGGWRRGQGPSAGGHQFVGEREWGGDGPGGLLRVCELFWWRESERGRDFRERCRDKERQREQRETKNEKEKNGCQKEMQTESERKREVER